MMKTIHSASQIARWFLYYNRIMFSYEDSDLITNLKLQKLLYYAQSAFLSIQNRPLFQEDLIHWNHGHAIPEVFDQYKNFGKYGIDCDDMDFTDPKDLLDEEDENLLIQVYKEFGQYSAWGLRNLVCQETPWLNTKPGEVLSHQSMEEFFLSNYVEES